MRSFVFYLAQATLIPLAISLVVAAMNREVLKAEKHMDERCFIVRPPRTMIWLGLVCALFFGALIVLMTIFPNDTTDWWVYLIFSLFTLGGSAIIIFCIFWKLEIVENEFHYVPFLGQRKIFRFDEIKKCKVKHRGTPNESIRLYSETRKLMTIDMNYRGYNILIRRLQQAGIPFSWGVNPAK